MPLTAGFAPFLVLSAATAAVSADIVPYPIAPVGPPAAMLAADLLPQLVPPADALTVAVRLEIGTYALPLRPPVPGRLAITWYQGTHPAASEKTAALKRLAGGATTFRRARLSQIKLTATPRGRRMIRAVATLAITAVARFSPTDEPEIVLVKTFTLR